MFLTALADADWSVLFVGAIFVAFPILLYIMYLKTNASIKKGRKLTAIVISCTKVDNGEVEAPHYEIVYEYTGKDGVKRTYQQFSDNDVKVGKAQHMFLLNEDKKRPVLMDVKDAQDNFKNKRLVQIALFGFAGLALVIVLFAFFSSIYPELSQFVSDYVFGPGISVLFVFIGICFLKSYFRKKAAFKAGNLKTLPATLIGYKISYNSSDDGPINTYFPIYEYVEGEKTHQFTSQYSSSTKVKKGTRVDLYVERETGKIIEKRTAKSDLIFAVGFSGMGLIALICLIAGYVSGI